MNLCQYWLASWNLPNRAEFRLIQPTSNPYKTAYQFYALNFLVDSQHTWAKCQQAFTWLHTSRMETTQEDVGKHGKFYLSNGSKEGIAKCSIARKEAYRIYNIQFDSEELQFQNKWR